MNPELALVEYFQNCLAELTQEALDEGIILTAETVVDPLTADVKGTRIDARRTVRNIRPPIQR